MCSPEVRKSREYTKTVRVTSLAVAGELIAYAKGRQVRQPPEIAVEKVAKEILREVRISGGDT